MSKVEISSITHCIHETLESTRKLWQRLLRAVGVQICYRLVCCRTFALWRYILHFFSAVANPFPSYNEFRFEKCCFHLSRPSEFGERSLHHPSSFCNSIVPAWQISIISRNQDCYWLHDSRHHLAILLRSIFPPV